MTQKTTKALPPIAPPSQGKPARLERFLRLLTRFERFAQDIAGVFCLALASMILVALLLPQASGGLLVLLAKALRYLFGWGSLWLVLMLGAAGLWLLYRSVASAPVRVKWGRVILMEGVAFTSLALLTVLGGGSILAAKDGLDGGIVGWGLDELLRLGMAPVGLSAAFWRACVWIALLGFFLIAGLGLAKPLKALAKAGSETSELTGAMTPLGPGPAVSEGPLQGESSNSPTAGLSPKKKSVLPPQFRKSFRVQPTEATGQPMPPRDERLPGLELLVNEQFSRPDERNINLTAGLIEKTLADFGIPAKVVGFRVGPTVTQFAVEPGYLEKEKQGLEGDLSRQKVRVAQISSLGRDLTLALSAERLRIEAPVPGRPYVGIEVPNLRSTVVRLRPILETEAFYKAGSPLTIGLGRDVSGQPVAADLGHMPHLLIAGTTGSGKSVCIAAITTCLVMNNTPEDLRLVMIDPKMVELVRFNGLPHLFGKVETDLERILGVLRWIVVEMERRYKLLEASHSRNLDTYNRKARRHREIETLPRIVVLIDELADLMMSAPDQTEHNLVRLAQMARATGIHLVVATQRPSTDVVTGLIKANFPARLSFAVASSIDSRVILDSTGAETLLGRGDMLFLPPEASAPVRLQGVMVSDQEVERVIAFWQRAIPSEGQAEISPWDQMIAEQEVLADRDGLVEQAIEIVRQTHRASASMLQRRLRIGYPRAARLVDELEELGVIGPAVGGGRDREVLVEGEEEEN